MTSDDTPLIPDRGDAETPGESRPLTEAEAIELGGPVRDERTDAILERARRFGEDGDFEAMAEHLREALEDDEDNPWILTSLGVAERELGMEGVAYERFKRALAAGPQDPTLLAVAGTGLADFDDPDAENALRTAALLGREDPAVRWRYGAWLTREGFLEEGIEELIAAARLDPEDATIAYELGVGYALQGKFDAAVDAVARSAVMGPIDEGWTRTVLGLLMIEAGRLDEAVLEFDLGAQIRPDDPVAQILAGLSRAASGAPEEAYEYLERARFHAVGTDELMVEEAEERVEDGPEAAERFLRSTVVPSELRERLAARP